MTEYEQFEATLKKLGVNHRRCYGDFSDVYSEVEYCIKVNHLIFMFDHGDMFVGTILDDGAYTLEKFEKPNFDKRI